MLPTVTIDQIRNFDPAPCYDPGRYLPEGWAGTALDVLAVEACPVEDRLWVALHEAFIDPRTMRLFAVWCARQALALIDNPDPRSVAACDVAERYANGESTDSELDAAWDAAMDAAMAAAMAAARTAAMAAAMAAATDAATDAARTAAWDAAWDAATDAARPAARDAQIEHLREMLS